MATYTKRGDGQWQAKIRKKGYPVQSKTFQNKARAQKWATQVEGQMDTNVFISSTLAENTTFQQLCDRYINDIVPSKKSARQMESMIRNICTHLGAYTAAALTPEVLVNYRDTRMKNVQGQTVRKDLLRIRRILTVASKEWGVYLPRGNPIDMITVPTQPKRGRDRRLEGNEEERLLAAAKEYGGEIHTIIQFAIETAMRRGEVYELRWENIDRRKKTAKLLDTKNGEDRKIPLSPKALQLLDALPRNLSGRVFSMQIDSITQAFERCCKRANIDDLRLHDLRHEATSRFFKNVVLIILIGTYAINHYLKDNKKKNLTETVRNFEEYYETHFSIVHPSALNFRWQARNPWFKLDVVPVIQLKIKDILEK